MTRASPSLEALDNCIGLSEPLAAIRDGRAQRWAARQQGAYRHRCSEVFEVMTHLLSILGGLFLIAEGHNAEWCLTIGRSWNPLVSLAEDMCAVG